MADYRDDTAQAVEVALPKMYLCSCGAKHEFDPWVYAHWDFTLTHVCDQCKTTNYLHKGKVIA